MAATVSPTSNNPYLDLVLSFPLRPIRSKAAHQRGKAMLRSLRVAYSIKNDCSNISTGWPPIAVSVGVSRKSFIRFCQRV